MCTHTQGKCVWCVNLSLMHTHTQGKVALPAVRTPPVVRMRLAQGCEKGEVEGLALRVKVSELDESGVKK